MLSKVFFVCLDAMEKGEEKNIKGKKGNRNSMFGSCKI